MTDVYRKVSALVVRDGCVLTITASRHPDIYCMPGGPAVEGESHEATLDRELAAELGTGLAGLTYVDRFEAVSGIDGALVLTELYRVELTGEPAAVQPGRALRWVHPFDQDVEVSTSVHGVLHHAIGAGLLHAALDQPPHPA
ncbi:NUDIX domain-containing protein [Actinomadura litoris]|uniref:NUDIX domain-containing protein n=1 Tax=Actinomadura litoris TaxID=2678616 RepID=A0A7K1LAK6_9ACTN|nr:NUDIX domain-containing protein [Actinomadura litoris]MUN41460.1 NUDIX domain-containing protein [Actinomadura litoris]